MCGEIILSRRNVKSYQILISLSSQLGLQTILLEDIHTTPSRPRTRKQSQPIRGEESDIRALLFTNSHKAGDCCRELNI